MIQNIKYNYCSGYYLVNLLTLVINKILCGTKWWSIYSLGAKFQKTASFFLVCLTQNVVEVLKKYLQNIVRVGVEVSRGSKILKLRDVQGYRRAPKTLHFLTPSY